MPWRSRARRPRASSARWTWRGRAAARSPTAARSGSPSTSDFLLKHLRRVLNENWRRLPEPIATATEIEIEVRWSEKAGAKRVVTDQPSELIVGSQSWSLPYQPCLSELLYGAPLYRQRRRDVGTAASGAAPRRGSGRRAAADLDRSARRWRRGRGRCRRRPPLSLRPGSGSEPELQQLGAAEQVDEGGQRQERAERDLHAAERLGCQVGAAARRCHTAIGRLTSAPTIAPTKTTNGSARQPSTAPMTASSLPSPRPSPSRLRT